MTKKEKSRNQKWLYKNVNEGTIWRGKSVTTAWTNSRQGLTAISISVSRGILTAHQVSLGIRCQDINPLQSGSRTGFIPSARSCLETEREVQLKLLNALDFWGYFLLFWDLGRWHGADIGASQLLRHWVDFAYAFCSMRDISGYNISRTLCLITSKTIRNHMRSKAATLHQPGLTE